MESLASPVRFARAVTDAVVVASVPSQAKPKERKDPAIQVSEPIWML